MQVEIVTNARSLRHREFSERGDAHLECRARLFSSFLLSLFAPFAMTPRHSAPGAGPGSALLVRGVRGGAEIRHSRRDLKSQRARPSAPMSFILLIKAIYQ